MSSRRFETLVSSQALQRWDGSSERVSEQAKTKRSSPVLGQEGLDALADDVDISLALGNDGEAKVALDGAGYRRFESQVSC